MNKKKIIITSIVLVILIIISFSVYYFLTREDKVTSLNLIEKQWIESNKNNVIDMSILSDIPILSYNGEGLIMSFLSSLNEQTNLSFNKVSYNLGEEVKTSYAFKLKDKIEDNDILIYEDNYALITKESIYKSIDDLSITVGVLNDDLQNINNYLFDSNIVFKTYSTKNEMLADLDSDKINAVAILKTTNLKDILTKNYKIAYNISDYKKYYVLSLGNEDKLNNILIKYYNKWKNDKYVTTYNTYLEKDYFKFTEVTDSDAVKFRSKRYTYGFILNSPYDDILDSKLTGINNSLISSFSSATNAEISYRKYDSIESLVDAFNKNEIDFFYGINNTTKYAMDVYETSDVYTNNLVILKHTTNNTLIKSIKSVSDIYTIKNSNIEEYLDKNNITYISYSNMDELIKNVNNNSIIIMDINNYNYYKDKLKEYIVCNISSYDSYHYIIRDISDNRVFSKLLDFYVTYNDTELYVTDGLNSLINTPKGPIILKYIAYILGSLLIILLFILSVLKIKPKKKRKKTNLSKEDKLRYIDTLTSLKNRNYLNDSVEKWDKSEVYPQGIIIIDLNNIAYINDNYGHTEGDLVITEAAGVLISNQLEKTEIVRTNGNEFLIYLVGYDEKQIVTYIKKLNKELKEIKHNFGAAIGYSMILDEIKTIDDAINEATIDMRNNKDSKE